MKPPSLISGIITKIRCLGKISFLTITSGSEIVNVVAAQDKMANYAQLKKINVSDYLALEIQIQDDEIYVVKIIKFMRNVRGNIPVTNNLEAYSELLNQIRKYFIEEGFLEVRLPSIHPGTDNGDIFEIDYFGKKARLSSSNALYSTVMATNKEKVYSIQRCYRAEPSKTSKHLAEFDMLEVSFIGSTFEDLIFFLSNFILDVFEKVRSVIPDLVTASPFKTIPIISYADLNARLKLSNKGLGKHEREIAKNGPVMVIHFPKNISTWSALPIDDRYTYSLNLLAPGVGEIVEGCLRDTRDSVLRNKFNKLGLENQLNWYLDLNPFPNIQVCSFGLGIERLAMWLFGISNIRLVNFFFRDNTFSESKLYGK